MFRWFRKSKSTGDTSSEYSTSACTSYSAEQSEEESEEEEDLEEQAEESESDPDTVVEDESGVSSLEEEDSIEESELDSVEIVSEKPSVYRQNTVIRAPFSAIQEDEEESEEEEEDEFEESLLQEIEDNNQMMLTEEEDSSEALESSALDEEEEIEESVEISQSTEVLSESQTEEESTEITEEESEEEDEEEEEEEEEDEEEESEEDATTVETVGNNMTTTADLTEDDILSITEEDSEISATTKSKSSKKSRKSLKIIERISSSMSLSSLSSAGMSKSSSRKSLKSKLKQKVSDSCQIEPTNPSLKSEHVHLQRETLFGLPRDHTGDALIDAATQGAQTTTKVSNRIQQLLQTLSKPRKKPLTEFYTGGANATALTGVPRATGQIGHILVGKPLPQPDDDLLELFLQHVYERPKEPAFTSWNSKGKLKTWTWSKLHAKALSAAHELTTRVELEAGDTVALMIPNASPFFFLASFMGCLLAEITPISIEMPITNSKEGMTARFGHLLRSANITVVITTPFYAKALRKRDNILTNWPHVEFESLHLKNAPAKFEFTPIDQRTQSSRFMEYNVQGGQIHAIVRPSKMIVHTAKRIQDRLGLDSFDVVSCLSDFKRQSGLMFAVLTPMVVGCHCLIFPFTVCKQKPELWIETIGAISATVIIGSSKEFGWGSMARLKDKYATKKSPLPDLSSVKSTIVTDGATPLAITYAVRVVSEMSSIDLSLSSVKPLVWSDLVGVVCLRDRADDLASVALNREFLTFGVVRESKGDGDPIHAYYNGSIVPGLKMAVVPATNHPYDMVQNGDSNKTETFKPVRMDELGEIIISGFGLDHQTLHNLNIVGDRIFKCRLDVSGNKNYTKEEKTETWSRYWVRTGILGAMVRSEDICTLGRIKDRLEISGRFHNSIDMSVSILQAAPFPHESRVIVFDIPVMSRRRIAVVAEQPPDVCDDVVYGWMNDVMSAINSKHHESVFTICTIPAGVIPRKPAGGVDIFEVRRRLLTGNLHPLHILCCPHAAIHNLPRAREKILGMGPNSIMQGFVVAGSQPAEISTDPIPEEIFMFEKPIHQLLLEIAELPSVKENVIMLNNPQDIGGQPSRLTFAQLSLEARKFAGRLLAAGIKAEDRVIVCLKSTMFPIGMYACLLVGCVPIPIRPPSENSISTVALVCRESKAKIAVTSTSMVRFLRKSLHIQVFPIDDVDESTESIAPIETFAHFFKGPENLCYADYTVSASGYLYGRPVTFKEIAFQCAQLKAQLNLQSLATVLCVLEPYNGLGLILSVFLPVYCGVEVFHILPSWSEWRVDALMALMTKHEYIFLQSTVAESIIESNSCQDARKAYDMRAVQQLSIVHQSKADFGLINGVRETLSRYGLRKGSIKFTKYNNICKSFEPSLSGIKVAPIHVSNLTPILALPMPTKPQLTIRYLDKKELRNDRIQFTAKGAPFSTAILCAGPIAPESKAIIVNITTGGQAGMNQIGELWISKNNRTRNYETVVGAGANFITENESLHATVKTGCSKTLFIRTGLLGFIMSPQGPDLPPELFITGRIADQIVIRGMSFAPEDIENCVKRAHRAISSCAAFSIAGLLAVAIELPGPEGIALDLSLLVTMRLLNELEIPLGIFVVLDPGTIPTDSAGGKQRKLLCDLFVENALDPIFVAYNM